MLADLLTRPCTVHTRFFDGLDDRFGNPAETETAYETLCELQQRTRTEATADGTVSVTTWALYLPGDATLSVGDRVTIDDVDYEVDGEPAVMRNPVTGVVEHLQATVVKTSGAAVDPRGDLVDGGDPSSTPGSDFDGGTP